MRVILTGRRRLHDERGATAVVLVMLLVLLIAMMALAIDGGMLWAKYRRARNANDAAALAAAVSCAKNEGVTAANAQANSVATANMSGATQTVANSYPQGCLPKFGTVTVRYGATQALAFAPAVGISSPKPVISKATAVWGGAGGSHDVIPMVVFPNRLSNCGFNLAAGTFPAIGTSCFFWYDDTALGSSTWGLLNLASWGTTSTPSGCSNDGGTSDLTQAITKTLDHPLLLSDPPPTYVCGKNGVPMTPIDNAIADALAAGRTTFAMPVDDPSLQVNTTSCKAGTCTTSPYKYAIVGFALLKPVDMYMANKQSESAKYHQCDSAHVGIPDSANAVCLEAKWAGFSTDGLVPGGGENFGLVSVGLQS